MDAVILARWQFALTALFHFIFVPLTLGLSFLVAIMETIYVKTNNPTYLRMTKFFGKLFLINFALGLVTGITLEFEFGMNWARYSKFVGDIFGAPLAIEATLAFFLESTFLGVWIFGWKKVSKKMHALSIWLVAFGTNISALWILIANAWMQHPVGYVVRNGRAEFVDFWAVVTQPYAILKFLHTITAGYVVGAFFVMGISAYHLLKNQEVDLFKRAFKIGAAFGLFATIAVFIIGDLHAGEVAKTQPTKLAAMESVWTSQKGAPMYLLIIPDEKHQKNAVELFGIPKMLSIIAYHNANATIKGLKDFPKNDRPPVTITFVSFRTMVGLGTLFVLLAIIAYYYIRKDILLNKKWFLKLMLFAIPLPYIAIELGWIVAEVGRQPWIVYGLMRTADATSTAVTVSQIIMSLIGFVLFYSILGAIDIYLLVKYAKQLPEKV
ncbi:cytochrome ubiquinol oxidase subunit I [Hippea maritima]|uniref:Cytochrome bd ubiquinol oxidase subunit I n=1 Tax=Hippea maritima (strain ATCC 700847 / DSM 10411 / MH2) TaxID=760142 RepID=F2LU51_HIPMA|nr:cytochrome ubiquinol oxidase subunit I [Hippea maritima]AEA34514.1 cytochrome bd ubiquinol oxidase subunit I [Hippea maritima DSM 10411]